MSSKKCDVSVLIRTRDIENRFPELLCRLSHQTLQPLELVIVDNFSSKKNLEEMLRFLSMAKAKFFNGQVCVKLVPIVDSEFSHPFSTNVGVYLSNGEFICITNGHSLPPSDKWLETGISPFKSQVAGVGGYYIPHKDGTIWEKIIYNSWSGLNTVSKSYLKDNHFSTVNCVIRKSSWKEYPFDERLPSTIPYTEKFGGEDYDWAVEMQARGYKVIIDPKFSVFHSHGETLPKLISKHVIWNRIKSEIKALKRPRESYTKLGKLKPKCYNL
ncbi:MAG: hypothetical protein QXX79_03155 [Candidatus Bathyarchaeia archaeon]